MSDKPNGKGWRWIRWATALLVLYVLSSGPATRLPIMVNIVLYFPLVVLGFYCPPFGNLLEWYLELWGG
jgi:hypothetical protein